MSDGNTKTLISALSGCKWEAQFTRSNLIYLHQVTLSNFKQSSPDVSHPNISK